MTEDLTKNQAGGNGGPAKGRDYFVEMARHPRSRVIMANTSDTFMLADIARQSDLIISRLRDALLRSVTVEEFTDAMDEYYHLVFALEDHLAKLGTKVGIKYRKSRTYKATSEKRGPADPADSA